MHPEPDNLHGRRRIPLPTDEELRSQIVEELNETVYGQLQYAALDLAGYLWLFSRYARDLSPEQWGAHLVSN
jgi:hypothetical protein